VSLTVSPPPITSESPRPALSLCLIAKNEEAMLPACLASVRDVVDEMIVVDTGSTDKTKMIAQQMGATVLDFKWIDDFAAARNFALDAARGQWILLLDADERLSEGSKKAIRAAIERTDLDCGLLPLHSADTVTANPKDVLNGKRRLGEPTLLPRLFRRTPDLRWEGLIHEAPSKWLARPGLRATTLEAPIIHLGDVPSIRTSLNKLDRNLSLLLKRREKQPADVATRVYIAEELYRKNNMLESRAEVERVWPMISSHWKNFQTGSPTLDEVHLRTFTEKAASLRMLLQVQSGDYTEGLATALACCNWRVDNPTLTYLEGVCNEQLAMFNEPQRKRHLENARQAYIACLQRKNQLRAVPAMEGMTSWRATLRLGTVLLQQGQPRMAIRQFQRTLKHRPNHVDAVLGFIESLVDEKQSKDALELLKPLLTQDNPDAQLLAAQAHADLMQFSIAERHLDIAYRGVRQYLRGPFRLTRLNRLIQESKKWARQSSQVNTNPR